MRDINYQKYDMSYRFFMIQTYGNKRNSIFLKTAVIHRQKGE